MQQELLDFDTIDDFEYSQERSNDIKDIVKGIYEVKDIVEDLQIIVTDQNEYFNQIDYNITETENNTKDAVEEIQEAVTDEPCCSKTIRYILYGLGVLVGTLALLLIGKFLFFR